MENERSTTGVADPAEQAVMRMALVRAALAVEAAFPLLVALFLALGFVFDAVRRGSSRVLALQPAWAWLSRTSART